jgi:hypothetical protein
MSESVVGLNVAATRQNAVRVVTAGDDPAGGLENPPATTAFAMVIAVCARVSEPSASQGVAVDWTGVESRVAKSAALTLVARTYRHGVWDI